MIRIARVMTTSGRPISMWFLPGDFDGDIRRLELMILRWKRDLDD